MTANCYVQCVSSSRLTSLRSLCSSIARMRAPMNHKIYSIVKIIKNPLLVLEECVHVHSNGAALMNVHDAFCVVA